MNDIFFASLPAEVRDFVDLGVSVDAYQSIRVPSNSRRVCFITRELLGFLRNGGSGAGYLAVAASLAAKGHNVTILYAGEVDMDDAQVKRASAAIGATGVKLLFFQEDKLFAGWDRFDVYRSFAIYRWLEQREFDIVHFTDFDGCAYYSCAAKRSGVAFRDTKLCVFARRPTRWIWDLAEEFVDKESMLQTEFTERRAIELADVVLAPSRYLLNWMGNNGFALPRESYIQPYPIRTLSPSEPSGRIATAPVTEIVFFGRQELRKGFKTFVDSIRKFGPSRPNLKITFLGKYSQIYGEHTGGYAVFMLKNIPNELSFYADFDSEAALRYLKRPGVLAVIPSADDNFPNTVLECVVEGINFIASNSGGIPEILDEETRRHRLFPYSLKALVLKLEQAIETQYPPAGLAYDGEKAEATFCDWHALAPCAEPRATAHSVDPLVTVCIIHYNRPQMLRQALASIDTQSYRNIEIIVVDHGSTLPQARAELDKLRSRTEPRPIRVVDTPDSGLGPARNAGARVATGEYLCFVDDDNVARPHMIETFVRAARASGSDILTCFSMLFKGDGIPEEDEQKNVEAFEFLPVGGAVALGFFRNAFSDANGFFRRETFESLSGFAEPGAPAEDWELYARARLAGYQVNMIPEPLFWRRIHSTRVSSRPQSKWQLYTQISNLYVANAFSGNPHPELKWIFRCVQALAQAGEARTNERNNLKMRENGPLYEGLLESNPEDTKRLMAELMAAAGRISDSMRMHAQRADYEAELTAREQLPPLNNEIRALRNRVIDTEATLAKEKLRAARSGSSWTRLFRASKDDDEREIKDAERELINSGLFGAEWYLSEYPDVANSGCSPAEHYLKEGYLRGYSPNPLFQTRWYLENYPDVLRAGYNPLLHYLRHGHQEGRNPSPDFQTEFYRKTYPDVSASGMNSLAHYLRYGRREGRLPTRPS